MQKKIAFSLSFFGLSACAGSWAQLGHQTGTTTLNVQVNEVVLPVSVRDKKGVLINTLKKSDFTLTEDGRPQTIKSFSQQSNLPFLVGILVDSSRSMDNARNMFNSAAGKFVDQIISGNSDGKCQAQSGIPLTL